MRLLERQYNFLELANWIVPLGWIFLAHRFHFPSWLLLAGPLLAFLRVNYKLSEGVPAPEARPVDHGPFTTSRAFDWAFQLQPISATYFCEANGCYGLYW
jgi:hypothetical protein